MSQSTASKVKKSAGLSYMSLEPRMVFDAALAATVEHAMDPGAHAPPEAAAVSGGADHAALVAALLQNFPPVPAGGPGVVFDAGGFRGREGFIDVGPGQPGSGTISNTGGWFPSPAPAGPETPADNGPGSPGAVQPEAPVDAGTVSKVDGWMVAPGPAQPEAPVTSGPISNAGGWYGPYLPAQPEAPVDAGPVAKVDGGMVAPVAAEPGEPADGGPISKVHGWLVSPAAAQSDAPVDAGPISSVDGWMEGPVLDLGAARAPTGPTNDVPVQGPGPVTRHGSVAPQQAQLMSLADWTVAMKAERAGSGAVTTDMALSEALRGRDDLGTMAAANNDLNWLRLRKR
jgi:hypothetical protein